MNICEKKVKVYVYIFLKGWLAIAKLKKPFTFYFSILTLLSILKKAFDREMKSERGFSFAMASQPF